MLQSQLNTEEIQKLSIFVSSLRKVLEHKNHVAKLMLSHTIKPNQINKYAIDISSIEEIIRMYNYIVGVYRKVGVNQQTRLTMKSIFMSLENYITSITQSSRIAIPKVAGTPNISDLLRH